MYRWFLALRYLLQRPINLLGMGGVMLGVWAMIVVVSIFSGFLEVASSHVKSAGSDLTALYLDYGASFEELRAVIEEDPNVRAASPRLVHYGLLHPRGQDSPRAAMPGRGALAGGDGPFLMLLGVDPALEQQTTDMREWLLAVPEEELRVADPERPLQPVDDLPTILLGADRMREDGIRRGDRVTLTTGRVASTAEGEQVLEKVSKDFVVAGGYQTRHVGFDGINTFVHIDVLRGLLTPGRPDSVEEISIRVRDPIETAATGQRLERALSLQAGRAPDPERSPYVQSWRERNRPILESVEHQRSLMKFVLIIIMVVAAFLMYATLSMMVTEKTRDIGILTAMGGTPGGVMQVFLSCGLTITGIGVVLGVIVGCLTSIYLDDFNKLMQRSFDVDLFPTKVYNIDRVPYDLDPLWIAQVCGIALLVGALVSALPAFRAARHDPLVSLRNE